jgi:hypothetical protein
MNASTAIGIGYIACFGALVVLIVRNRPKRPALPQRITQANARTAARTRTEEESADCVPAPPHLDCKPGTDAAALDWIELTYGMAAYDGPGWAPGHNRFRAIHDDDTTKGDQQ